MLRAPFHIRYARIAAFAVVVGAGVFGVAGFGQAATITWDGGTSGSGSAWLTGTNWNTDTVPGATDIAAFGLAGTSGSIGINLNTAGGDQQVGAIQLLPVLGNRARTIGDSSDVSGSLTLNGTTVNGISNTVLANDSSATLTLAPNVLGGTGVMSVALGNALDNVIQINGTGLIVISTAITGTGKNLSLTGTGIGTLNFTGSIANTYTGTTTVNAGELILSKTAGATAIAGDLIVGDGSGTDIVKLTASNQIADTSDVTINSSGLLSLINNSETIDGLNSVSTSAVLSMGSGTLTIGANDDPSASFAGVISGSGSVVKIGNGTQTLSGANTYSGGTTLNAGTLQLGSSSTGSITNGPVGKGTLTLNGGTISSNVADFVTTRSIANAVVFGGDVTFGTNTNFGALDFSGAGTLTGNRALTFVANTTFSGNIGESGGSFGITKNGSGTLKLSGFNTYSGGTTVNAGLLWLGSTGALGSTSGSLTVNAGILDLGGNSVSVGNLTGSGGTIWNNLNATNSTATLTVGTNNTGGGNYQGVIKDNNTASNGILALTKTGSGTITLSGANTYTGATTINGGTLLINGSTGGSAVTVNSTGTLGGTGTVGGTVTVNSGGTIRGGTGTATSGALTVNNTLTLNSNSVIQLALGAAGAHSTLALGGSVTFQLNQQFNFIDLGAQTTTYDNIITGVTTPVATGGWTITNPGWTGVFTYDSLNQSIDLNLIAVPEPGTWFGAALAMSILLCTQRRRIARRKNAL